jgi:transposase
MQGVSVLGVDLAKNVFQLHGVAADGRVVLRRRVSRSQLLGVVGNLSPCLIGIEACGGSRYWAGEFAKLGHEVRMMPAQYVRPFVKTNKNDSNDAEAICEAVQRPGMRFVAPKSRRQQEIQTVHRVRAARVANRTELINELRAMLSDLGITAGGGPSRLRRKLVEVLAQPELPFSGAEARCIRQMMLDWERLDESVKEMEALLGEVYRSTEVCQRLATIPGVGELTATAVFGAVGDPRSFKSGRHFAAWLGLVPRQSSSGNKQRLLGISKRGDRYLRALLVHGGRSVVRTSGNKTDRRSRWIADKAKTRGKNKAAVAVANKNARVIWKLLTSEQVYRTFP